MKYWTSVIVGLAVCTASLVGASWAIYHLVRTGTCASGGPYVSARPCPPGTGGQILALVGGIFGVFIGGGIYMLRGGHRRTGRVGLGTMLWTLGFCMLAGGGILGAYGPAHASASTGGKTGALIVAVVFIPMGIAPLLFSLFGSSKDGGEDAWNPPAPDPIQAHHFATPRPAGAGGVAVAAPFVTFTTPTAPAATPSGPDAVTRLEQLAKLHAEGSLTDSEFAAAKARLIARG